MSGPDFTTLLEDCNGCAEFFQNCSFDHGRGNGDPLRAGVVEKIALSAAKFSFKFAVVAITRTAQMLPPVEQAAFLLAIRYGSLILAFFFAGRIAALLLR
jgi:hypothetical protein